VGFGAIIRIEKKKYQIMSDSIWPKPKGELTDIELLDLLIDTDVVGPDPRYLSEVRNRGLLWAVNWVRGTKAEQKAQVRANLATTGRYSGDPEIEQIADIIDRIRGIQLLIQKCKSTNTKMLANLANDLKSLADGVNNFYDKPPAK
jgi:hypothetical protein